MFSFANGCSNNKRGICKLLGDLVQNEPNHVKDYFLLVLYIKPSPRIPLGSSPDEFPWCAGLLAVGLSSLPPSLLFKHQLEHICLVKPSMASDTWVPCPPYCCGPTAPSTLFLYWILECLSFWVLNTQQSISNLIGA